MVACAEYLLWRHQYVDAHEYVSTDDLIGHLGRTGHPVSVQALRQSVIAPLRDAGLLISSSTTGGYKILGSLDDVRQYLDIVSRNVEPSIGRARKFPTQSRRQA